MNALLAKFPISHKTILFLLIFILIPLIALAISITWIANNALQSSINEPLQTLTCNQLARINEKIQGINILFSQIENIDNFQNLSSLNAIQLSEFEEAVNEIVSSNQIQSSIAVNIIPQDSAYLHFGSQDLQIDSGLLNSLDDSISNSEIFYATVDNFFLSLKKLGSGQNQTLLAIYLSDSFLNSEFRFFSKNYGYFLLSDENQIIIDSQPAYGSFQIEKYLENISENGTTSQGDMQATTCTNTNNWKLILITPENFSIANYNLLLNIFIIVILVDAIFTLLIALLLDRKMLAPINKIADRIRKLNNDEEVDFKSLNQNLYSGEIKDLIIEYNQLIENQSYSQERDLLLNEKSDRIETAIQGSKIGIWDWDLKTNHCYYSSSWRNIIGHTEESMHNLPTEWFTRVHPEDIEALKSNISNFIDGKTSFFEHDHRLLHFNNTYIWVQAKGVVKTDESGTAIRLIGTLENISERKSLELKLLAEAMYDPLTGLPNRTYFSGVIDQSLARIHRREDYHSAVLYIDLDRFKTINDNYSFVAGNAMLIEITRRLKFSLRSMDTIARLSDDKFVVLLEEINGLPDTLKIIHRLNKEISKPFLFSGSTINPGASIGIVMLTRGYQEANEVLRDAESALFQAKSDGRGKFEIYDKDIYSYTLSKIRIENDLKLALKNKEFSLFIQPVFNTQSNQVIYANTNLYWQHPEKGFIPRAQYYNIAEEGGEIIALDHYLLRNACDLASEWHKSGHNNIILTIPISTKMILQPDFPEKVLSALADSTLPNKSLQLAITESSKIYSSGIAVQAMVNLSSIGVKFCLADYGVIPSSLEQLKRLPIHTINISDTLIRDLPKNGEDASITEGIISLAKILGYKLIATGVDTQEQGDFLIQKGIELIAGDYYSKPLDPTEFKLLISDEKNKL